MLLSMKQHNGVCACCFCYHSGMAIGDDHLHRYWPYDCNTVARSHESVLEDIREATESHIVQYGDQF